jgi:phosphoribosylanthranilate isomerase
MSLLIKICGLSRAADVAVAVRSGADAIGFVFSESPRRVTPLEAAAAARNVPDTVMRVAVMRHPDNEEWQRVLEDFSPDALQADAGDFAGLELPASVVAWPVYREGGSAPESAMSGIWLYEGPASGAGQTVDWQRAAKLARRGHMILAGGLSPDNVASAIAAVRPGGVDVSSGVESVPGEKDPALITSFITTARAAEST